MLSSSAEPDLASITWDHAVNDQAKLSKALTSSYDMLEADVVLGNFIQNASSSSPVSTPNTPIMAHPPANSSSLSLDMFLNITQKHNTDNNKKVGIKLDFKSIEAFDASITLIKAINFTTLETWINADILAGPVNNIDTTPVDSAKFLKQSLDFPNATLSIGWTTKWGSNYTTGSYTAEHIDNMIKAIENNTIKEHPITFPLRAGIAANSLEQIERLIKSVNAYQNKNATTITLWTSDNDHIDINKLKEVVNKIGKSKVYIDVPDDIKKQITTSGAGVNTINIISLVATVIVALFLNSY